MEIQFEDNSSQRHIRETCHFEHCQIRDWEVAAAHPQGKF